MTEITETVARKVLTTVDAGLCKGKGVPTPGSMCVEAAVCFALDLPHSDNPPCVHPAVRSFKICLNDKNWSSNAARAKGMRRIAVAQLGSTHIDGNRFAELLAIGTMQRIVPKALRLGAKLNPDFADRLEVAAKACETVKTRDEAIAAGHEARAVARAAAYADAEREKARDEILAESAAIGCGALIACGSEGAKWLFLCDEAVS